MSTALTTFYLKSYAIWAILFLIWNNLGYLVWFNYFYTVILIFEFVLTDIFFFNRTTKKL